MFKSIVCTAFITLLLFVAPCDAADNPSALVGIWVGVSGSDKGTVMGLLSDGTGVLTKDSKGLAITWKTEKYSFYITISDTTSAVSYKLQSPVLTFTEDDGKINEYVKCNKNCEAAVKEYVKAKSATVKKSSFTDSRDSKSYKAVKFDKQIWMAENLNYNAAGSKCYGNNESNCQKYGRLYNWETAKSACPKGWHLPSKDEWQILVDLVGGDKISGKMLKASRGWNKDSNGVDAFGFSALPGGYGSLYNFFKDAGSHGYWWSSSEGSSYSAYSRYMGYYYESVNGINYDRNYLFSVRCVQD